MLKPEIAAPSISLPLAQGGIWSLKDEKPAALSLITFYRGAFCGFCRAFLGELDLMTPEFGARGISTVAISTDDCATAQAMVVKEGLKNLRVVYGLTAAEITMCELYASRIERAGETLFFAEPSLWLVRPDGRIYAIFQNSMSCARPDLPSLIKGIDMLAAHDFPARGDA